MKALGLNHKNPKDLEKFEEIQKEKTLKEEEERLAKEELERINNPSEIDLLKEIRDLLKK